jgi:hypothetical protein
MGGLLILALFCFIMGSYSIVTGTLVMKGVYNRELRPMTYWFGTIMYFAMGIGSSIAAAVKYFS